MSTKNVSVKASNGKRAKTMKREIFARCIVAGMNGVEAHREAYGGSCSNKSRASHAWHLKRAPDVVARMDQLVKEQLTAAGVSEDYVMSGLKALADDAEGEQTKFNALKALGQTEQGGNLFTEKKEIVHKEETPEELIEELKLLRQQADALGLVPGNEVKVIDGGS